MTVNVMEVLRTSATLVVLVLCSILSVVVMIERWLYYRKRTINVESFMQKFEKLLAEKDVEGATGLCQQMSGSVPTILSVGLSNHGRPKEDVQELMASGRMEERLRLERWLGALGTMGNIAPFIGLFGTVVGIIKAFHDLAMSGSGGPSVVAAGIAEALVATAGGLLVAIPAVISYNYFMKKVKVLHTQMEVCSRRLLVLLPSGQSHAK